MPWNKTKKTKGEVLREYAISSVIIAKKIYVRKNVENTSDEVVNVKR